MLYSANYSPKSDDSVALKSDSTSHLTVVERDNFVPRCFLQFESFKDIKRKSSINAVKFVPLRLKVYTFTPRLKIMLHTSLENIRKTLTGQI